MRAARVGRGPLPVAAQHNVSNPSKPNEPGGSKAEWESFFRQVEKRAQRLGAPTPSRSTSQSLPPRPAPQPAPPGVPGQPPPRQAMSELERHARETAETLLRERQQFRGKVRQMEAKLRRLEPWVRELTNKVRGAADERARLEQTWRHQLLKAKEGREEARTEIKQLRARERDAVRGEEEIRRLRREIEQLESQVAMHQAVAMAAQSKVEDAQKRVSDLEEGGAVSSIDDAAIPEALESARSKISALQESEDSLRSELLEANETAREAMRGEDEALQRVGELEKSLAQLQAERRKDMQLARGGLPSAFGDQDERVAAARSIIADMVRKSLERLALEIEGLSETEEEQAAEGGDWLDHAAAAILDGESLVPEDWEQTLVELRAKTGAAAEASAAASASHDELVTLATLSQEIPAEVVDDTAPDGEISAALRESDPGDLDYLEDATMPIEPGMDVGEYGRRE